MYLTITAAADIKIVYYGNQYDQALQAVISEARKFTQEAAEMIPATMPDLDDWTRLKDGWSFIEQAGKLSITVDGTGAEITYGDDRVLICIKEIQLSRQQLSEMAELYAHLIQEEVVSERFLLHGVDKRSQPELFQKALEGYPDALEDGHSESDALEQLESLILRSV